MDVKDLIIVGGGINGAGLAADAAGRGLSVLLLESKNLASSTSSASSKLIHGGLRYLEHYEFRLVKEALEEREVLLKMAPHIIYPMRFYLPHRPNLRSAWIIRLGLFIYDFLGKRVSLPASKKVKFDLNSLLKPEIKYGFEYSDCWVDDARLVLLNAQKAVEYGSEIKINTKVTKAVRSNDGIWEITGKNHLTNKIYHWKAKGLVNATGPWVKSFIDEVLELKSQYNIRLIKGSHIVIPNLGNESKAYILQNNDKRIVFVIPWMEKFFIIGTTDVEYHGNIRSVKISDDEIEYLIKAYNSYFLTPIEKKDVVWTYSGIRPICDDESHDPQRLTRDYTLSISDENGKAPLLSIFGGKITTYRKLAEHALKKLNIYYPNMKGDWTKNTILPGGDFKNTRNNYVIFLRKKFKFLTESMAVRYSKTYGTKTEDLLSGTKSISDLGKCFGHDFYEIELKYLIEKEWVLTLEDAIWNRTKLGIWLNQKQKNKIKEWLEKEIKK